MSGDLILNIRGCVMLASMMIILRFLYYLNHAVPDALFGEREKRCMRLRRTAGLSAAVVILTIGACFMVDYIWLAELRRTPHACIEEISSNGKYVAKRCVLDAGYEYLRLYDNRTGDLVADRTYQCEASVALNVIMGDNMVFDSCAHDAGTIMLPPSLLDRLRAKLP